MLRLRATQSWLEHLTVLSLCHSELGWKSQLLSSMFLLSLLACSHEQVIAGMRHAQKVIAVQSSTVTVVLTVAQRFRISSLSLDTGVQALGRYVAALCSGVHSRGSSCVLLL